MFKRVMLICMVFCLFGCNGEEAEAFDCANTGVAGVAISENAYPKECRHFLYEVSELRAEILDLRKRLCALQEDNQKLTEENQIMQKAFVLGPDRDRLYSAEILKKSKTIEQANLPSIKEDELADTE